MPAVREAAGEAGGGWGWVGGGVGQYNSVKPEFMDFLFHEVEARTAMQTKCFLG
jgi:hypothetical protein